MLPNAMQTAYFKPRAFAAAQWYSLGRVMSGTGYSLLTSLVIAIIISRAVPPAIMDNSGRR
jgi:hypothetical protein